MVIFWEWARVILAGAQFVLALRRALGGDE
jgi:hypothetical protein